MFAGKDDEGITYCSYSYTSFGGFCAWMVATNKRAYYTYAF